MSVASLQNDLAVLNAPRMVPAPHQLMYRTLRRLAVRLGSLLKAKAEAVLPRQGLFRRNTVRDRKHRTKVKKLGWGRTQSQVDYTATAPCELEGDQVTDEFRVELAAKKFHEAVEDLQTFVGTFRMTSKFVFHLASMRRMFMDLQAVGEKLEAAMKAVGVSATDVEDPQWTEGWRQQLQADRDQEEAGLFNQAAKNALPFARSMRPHEPMEALTLLKFEIDNFKTDNSKVHINSMKKVFFSVVRSSNGRVARIPEWYIPPYALSYARDKGIVGSVGESFHGVWVDRKPTKPKPGEEDVKVVSHAVVVKRVEIHVDAIETFRKEVELWYTLQHENLLTLYGASHCSHPAILVTEEAANGPLVQFLQEQRSGRGNRCTRAPLVPQEWPYRNQRHAFWSLFLEAARGLQYLHEKKIVHGNLKSNNILMTADHHVKLADFGLGMLMLQNQMIQDTVVEQRKQTAYKEKAARGLTVQEPPVVHVKPFNDMGWRAPNLRAKMQYGRPTFQDDVYSLGLCVLDALVPKLSSIESARGSFGSKHVGDEAFDPLSDAALKRIINDNDRKLVVDMCSVQPEQRPSLKEVISRMEEMRDFAAQQPADSSDCCIL